MIASSCMWACDKIINDMPNAFVVVVVAVIVGWGYSIKRKSVLPSL